MNGAVEEIVDFQLRVANGWIDEANSLVGRPRLQFVGYFTALNALYWLWGMMDGRESLSVTELEAVTAVLARVPEGDLSLDLRKKLFGGLRNEAVLLQALVEKLGNEVARGILDQHGDYLQYLLVKRERPIHRMDKRSRDDADGDPAEGRKYRRWLRDARAPDIERLKGLASILYLIRCNLVHGSKVAHHEDGDLVSRSVPPLRDIALAAFAHTDRGRPT